MKINKEDFHTYITTYEEDELFYKTLYFKEKNQPDTFLEYVNSLDNEYIKEHELYIPILHKNWYPLLKENQFFTNKHNNIILQKHNRYTPLFNHSHEYYEVAYVYEGKADMEIQKINYTLKKGDVCIIPPSTYHSVGIFDDSILINILIQSSTFQNTFFHLLSFDNSLSNFFSHVLLKRTEGNYLIFKAGEDRRIQSAIEDLFIEYRGHAKYSIPMLNTMLMSFWAQLLRYHEDDIISFLTREDSSFSMTKILDYINTNFQTVSLQDIAHHFGYSTQYLSTLIKEGTGKTFSQIKTQLKLEKACRMLTETKLSITNICSLIGYDNPEHFMRLFKKNYGLTPGKYREENQN